MNVFADDLRAIDRGITGCQIASHRSFGERLITMLLLESRVSPYRSSFTTRPNNTRGATAVIETVQHRIGREQRANLPNRGPSVAFDPKATWPGRSVFPKQVAILA
jgi:hypothetical protein